MSLSETPLANSFLADWILLSVIFAVNQRWTAERGALQLMPDNQSFAYASASSLASARSRLSRVHNRDEPSNATAASKWAST